MYGSALAHGNGGSNVKLLRLKKLDNLSSMGLLLVTVYGKTTFVGIVPGNGIFANGKLDKKIVTKMM